MGIESFEQVCLVNGLIHALKVKAECVLVEESNHGVNLYQVRNGSYLSGGGLPPGGDKHARSIF